MNSTTNTNETALVAIDWGSSALRGARLSANGEVLEQRSFARGVLTVAADEFATVFETCFGDWTGAGDARCLISGMAGSKQGWREAPYCPCPTGFDDLAARLMWLDLGAGRSEVAIVPGLSCEHACDLPGLPSIADVMRGEEVQIFGAIQLTGLRDGIFVLPGTHSKWVQVSNGRVAGFQTYMSGEFFALLSQQSILSRTLDKDAPPDESAFALGVRRAAQLGGLLHHAFGARTLALFSRMDAASLTSYLSGLVIGAELAAQTFSVGTQVVVVGTPALTKRYAQGLAIHGVPARMLDAQATWAGLLALSNFLPKERVR